MLWFNLTSDSVVKFGMCLEKPNPHVHNRAARIIANVSKMKLTKKRTQHTRLGNSKSTESEDILTHNFRGAKYKSALLSA